MKPLVRSVPAIFIACTLASVLHAHPGHDDGHELTWDLGHLIAHPGATLLCFGSLAACGYIAYRLACWARQPEQKQ